MWSAALDLRWLMCMCVCVCARMLIPRQNTETKLEMLPLVRDTQIGERRPNCHLESDIFEDLWRSLKQVSHAVNIHRAVSHVPTGPFATGAHLHAAPPAARTTKADPGTFVRIPQSCQSIQQLKLWSLLFPPQFWPSNAEIEVGFSVVHLGGIAWRGTRAKSINYVWEVNEDLLSMFAKLPCLERRQVVCCSAKKCKEDTWCQRIQEIPRYRYQSI